MVLSHPCCNAKDSRAPEYPEREVLKFCSGDAASDITICNCMCIQYVWYGMVWHGMAWHGMVCNGIVWYVMVCNGM